MQDFTLGLSLSQIEETHWAKESRKVVSAKGTEMLLVWCNHDKIRTRYYKSIFGYLQRYFFKRRNRDAKDSREENPMFHMSKDEGIAVTEKKTRITVVCSVAHASEAKSCLHAFLEKHLVQII